MKPVDCIKRKYSGITRHELEKHIRFCCRALARDSSVDVIFPHTSGRVPIWMRKYKTKADCLELQISSGHLGRSVVEKAASGLESKGVEFKRRFTKKRRALSRIITSHEVEDVFTPKFISDIIVLISKFSKGRPNKFSIEYAGKLEKGCIISDDDPVEFGIAYKAAFSIGHATGSIAKLFKV